MEAFLVEWGTEIILSLVIAMLTYFFKKGDKEKDAQMKHYQELLEEERSGKIEKQIEVNLEPIYAELQEIRDKIEKMDIRIDDETQKVDTEFKLIISSYKYRLTQLCKELQNQGFMYQYQFNHLNEFYNLYTSLGGNGMAKVQFEKTVNMLEVKPDPDEYHYYSAKEIEK